MINVSRLKIFLLCLFAISVSVGSFAEREVVRFMHVSTEASYMSMLIELEIKFEASHRDIDIQVESVLDKNLKAFQHQMLQSDYHPNILYSWGGGDLASFAREGLLADVTNKIPAISDRISKGGMSAFQVDGQQFGYPSSLTQVGFWYNKTLFLEAGINAEEMSEWEGFLQGISALKQAGIVPIALGGGDKWPIHFYWSYLAMRTGGQETFNQVLDGQLSWNNKYYIRASELLLELADLQPFQENFENYTYTDASAYFGNHNAAMHLMGDWDIGTQRSLSESFAGVSDRDLGFMPFPSIRGGLGSVTDTLGGVNGWVFSTDGATPGALAWIDFLLTEEVQRREAKLDITIPVVIGSDDGVKNDFKAQIAKNIARSQWHQIFLDQALGTNVGGIINDISFGLATQRINAREAIALIQRTWDKQ
ncbi:ABC transporter substrate-binding protein [Reinekea sp.]|jgi:raffinose/stachyose/melibiose transport system substrate-binding protein|uniref:ABC transporter substrate-binding protein n=1 Tax=Reinekea sp. TaxID=1970455 RepID=UPI00398A505B